MALATIADVEVEFGDIDAPEQRAKVGVLLERAEAQVRRVFSDLDARIVDGRTDRVLVVQVESEMVLAVLRNPDAVQAQTESEGTGPFTRSRTVTVNLQAASGLLRLTPEHRALLGEIPLRGPYTVALSG